MLKLKFNIQNKKQISSLVIFLIFTISFLSIIFLTNNKNYLNPIYLDENNNSNITKKPKISAYLGDINITNYQINKTRHYHNETVPIMGKIYEVLNPAVGFPGLHVAVLINGTRYDQYNNVTDANGYFWINNFTFGFGFDIYSAYKIEVDIIEDTGEDFYDKKNHLILYANATSYFDISAISPGIPGENYGIVQGILKYDNKNGMGIPNKQLNSSWYNVSTIKIKDNLIFTTDNNGFFSPSLLLPNDTYSDYLFLNISYFGDPIYINKSQTMLNISLFRNITCVWNTVSTASEGDQITIRGQVLSNKTKFPINNREVKIYYGAVGPIRTIQTDMDGYFQFSYQIPAGTGSYPIEVEVVNSLGNLRSNTTHYITITGAIPSDTSSPSGKSTDSSPPFFNFFMVLIPIIIGGVAAFTVYAYFFLIKQKKGSLLVKVPLEGRIRNLKILKDTGRLEESLSYLFQAIYLELINAKYGRIKGKTETIRDFAIISVKELNLNPANIYPFIQNVEKIIYDKPFIITDEEFYAAVDLFSPIYFELTGYNFILNF